MSRSADLALRLWAALPPGFEIERDIEIGRAGGRALKVHVARRRRGGPRPAVAYIFGGGWQSNGPDQGLAAIAGLAMRGYVGASLDYRLSHEATFPAQIEDVRRGIRHLRSHATEYGIDPGRIGVIGLSSGGHLAALLATTARQVERPQPPGELIDDSDVQAVAVWAAPIDFLSIAAEHGNADSDSSMTARLLGGPLNERSEAVREANPLTYATAAMPPFLIVHGARDRLVPPGQGRMLFEGLRHAGVRAELLMVPGKGHGFLGLKAVRHTLAFFDRELKGRT